jgi:hypothetical protein
VDLFDNFTVNSPGYLRGWAFDIFDTDIRGVDQLGRYTYRLPLDPDGSDYASDRMFENFIFRNIIGAKASRLIPTETRLSFGGFHENMWSQGLQHNIPSSVDVLYARAESERENLRFKPHIHYQMTHSNNRSGWEYLLYGGIKGPVTDYINFLGETGYYWSGNSRRETMVWTVRFDHDINPTMQQSLAYIRNLTSPIRALRTSLSYNFRKMLGPDLYLELGADRTEYEAIDRGTGDTLEYRAGARLTYNMSPRLRMRTGGYYRWLDLPSDLIQIWTIRSELSLKLTEKMDARLMHQFETRQDDPVAYGYAENMVLLTITREF